MRGGPRTYGGALRDTHKCGSEVNACLNVHHLIAVHLLPADTSRLLCAGHATLKSIKYSCIFIFTQRNLSARYILFN